jgi:O-antigen ligase
MSGVYEQTTELELNGDIEALASARKPRLPLVVVGAAVLTLFFVAQILQVIPALGKFQIAKVAVAVVGLMFLSSRERIASRVRILSSPQLRYLLAILLIAFVTIPFSEWPSNSFRFITEAYVKNIVFVYLLIQTVRSDRDSRVVAGALVAGCSVVVIAMLTGFGPEVTMAEDERLNVAGTYDANDLALLFVVTIPFAFFMLKDSRPLRQLLLVAGLGLMLIGIVKSGSRGGFIGLVVVGALLMLRGSRQARKYTLVTVLVGAALFAFAAPPAYWNRINTIFNYEKDYNLNAREGRLMIWQTGLKMVAARPLTGVGIDCFPIAHSKFSGTSIQMSPHNTLVQIASELGLGGLALFCLIAFSSLLSARRIRVRAREGRARGDLEWLASAIEASFTGFLVSAFFLTHAYSAIFCFLAAMSAALIIRSRASDENQSEPVENQSEPVEIQYS